MRTHLRLWRAHASKPRSAAAKRWIWGTARSANIVWKLALVICSGGPLFAEAIDFQRDVAPLLAEHCLRCHSPNVSKGDLSMAGPTQLLDQGHIVPGAPEESYLLELVSGEDGEAPSMPQDGAPLNPEEVRILRDWIAQGAAWPAEVVVREASKANADWWSLQPIQRDHGAATIDRLIEARLAEAGLAMNPPADRATLIRRVTYDLIGLPPTPEEVASFVADPDPEAYLHLVERLLASPHYGERWGRHWLDVVRFGESNGFERNVIINNLWPFRDYVIRSLNEDKPFDQFLREHLAGDVEGANDPQVAIGSAFLVAGPYDDVGNQDAVQAAQIRANTLDEMISTTGQAFLGLTIGCARCHDHKFDPIRQTDYYGLYATFAGVKHGAVTLATPEAKAQRAQTLDPLEKQKQQLEGEIEELRNRVSTRAQQNRETHAAQWTRPAVDRRGTEDRFPPVEAKFVRLVCERRDTDVRSARGFGIDELEIWSSPEAGQDARNVALARAGARATGPARKIEDFPGAYAAALAIDGQFGARFLAADNFLQVELAETTRVDRVVFSSARGAETPRQGKFAFVADYRIEVSLDGEQWTEVAHGRDRACTDYDQDPTHEAERLFAAELQDAEQDQLRSLTRKRNQVQREISQVPALDVMFVGRREAAPGPFHVFLGGSPQRPGEKVQPQGLHVLDAFPYPLPEPNTEAARRMALARWITHPQHPLTPRVLANRVWHYHFGRGIVATPSDLGYMGDRPSHPQLLDYLADQLLDAGWRWKPLHRLIVLSQAYRQASTYREDAARVDADARLLWRFPPRRLSAEEIRDTLLSVGGKLERETDLSVRVPDGGPGFRLYHFMQDNVCTYVPLDTHGPSTYRRAVYHQNARATVVDLMSDFDQPDCALPTPRRASTTTPLQALTMLNHQFTLDMAQAMSDRIREEVGDAEELQVERAYWLCYGRAPQAREHRKCQSFVAEQGLAALCRVLLNTSELIYVQ